MDKRLIQSILNVLGWFEMDITTLIRNRRQFHCIFYYFSSISCRFNCIAFGALSHQRQHVRHSNRQHCIYARIQRMPTLQPQRAKEQNDWGKESLQMTKKLKEKYFSKLLKDKQLSDGRIFFFSFFLPLLAIYFISGSMQCTTDPLATSASIRFYLAAYYAMQCSWYAHSSPITFCKDAFCRKLNARNE